MKNKFLIVLLFVLPPILLSQDKTTIAVLDFDALGVSVTETNVIIDRLRTEIFKTNKYMLLERKKMKDILDEQGFQMSGCSSNECAVEAGQSLGVQQMIVGSIGKVSDVFTISGRIIDVETGKILKVANYDDQGDLSGLLMKGMRELASALSGEQIKDSNINKQKDTFVNEIQEGNVTDIDGNVYNTIKIGNQIWMAENLVVTHYRNGDPIPNVTSASEWSAL